MTRSPAAESERPWADGDSGGSAAGVQIEGAGMLAPIGTKQMWEQIERAKQMAAVPPAIQTEMELMRKHLRKLRKFVQSQSEDDEIKRLIGE